MWDCIAYILIDTIKVFPAIFLVYVLIELFEQKVSFFKNGKFLKAKGAPLYGAVAGIIPQCGISVMASKLYEKKLIKVGTLFAVFIATSDEGITILISKGEWKALLWLVVFKFVLAVIVGFIVNGVAGRIVSSSEDEVFEHKEVCAHCHHEHEHEHENFFEKYLLVPLKHSLVTLCFVLCVNATFGLLFYFIGEQPVIDFLKGTRYYQPFIASLIGLIPNCASSVIITQLYVEGGITFASMFAGLVSNAGIGLAVFFKDVKRIKRNLIITVALYLIALAVGLLLTLIS